MVDENEPNILAEVGSTGLRQFSGYVQEEWHPKLRGIQAVKIYREMSDNDAVIGAIMWAIKMLIRQADWKVEASGDTPAHHEAADFVESCRTDMEFTWQEFLSEVLEMLVYGWAAFEKVYKIRRGREQESGMFHSKFDDGRIGWRKFGIRAQDTLLNWDFDEAGCAVAMNQIAPPTFRFNKIPMKKLVNFRLHTNRNNPEGRSILRNAYRSWFFLKRIQEIEAIGVERDLAGLPVMEVPLDIMAKDADTAKRQIRQVYEDMIRKVKRNEYEGLVIPTELDREAKPTGYRLRLLSSGGRRPVDVNEIVKRWESRIAISALAEFVMVGLDKVGARAVAETKTDLFGTALGAIMDTVTDTFDRELIPELLDLNGIPTELAPNLKHGDVDAPSVKDFALGLQSLIVSGAVTPENGLEKYVREYAGLPPIEQPAVRTPKPGESRVADPIPLSPGILPAAPATPPAAAAPALP